MKTKISYVREQELTQGRQIVWAIGPCGLIQVNALVVNFIQELEGLCLMNGSLSESFAFFQVWLNMTWAAV